MPSVTNFTNSDKTHTKSTNNNSHKSNKTNTKSTENSQHKMNSQDIEEKQTLEQTIKGMESMISSRVNRVMRCNKNTEMVNKSTEHLKKSMELLSKIASVKDEIYGWIDKVNIFLTEARTANTNTTPGNASPPHIQPQNVPNNNNMNMNNSNMNNNNVNRQSGTAAANIPSRAVPATSAPSDDHKMNTGQTQPSQPSPIPLPPPPRTQHQSTSVTNQPSPPRTQHQSTSTSSPRTSPIRDEVQSRLFCAICRCKSPAPCKLPCGHIFCAPCVNEWINARSTCPLCRTGFDQYVGDRLKEISKRVESNREEVTLKWISKNPGLFDAFNRGEYVPPPMIEKVLLEMKQKQSLADGTNNQNNRNHNYRNNRNRNHNNRNNDDYRYNRNNRAHRNNRNTNNSNNSNNSTPQKNNDHTYNRNNRNQRNNRNTNNNNNSTNSTPQKPTYYSELPPFFNNENDNDFSRNRPMDQDDERDSEAEQKNNDAMAFNQNNNTTNTNRVQTTWQPNENYYQQLAADSKLPPVPPPDYSVSSFANSQRRTTGYAAGHNIQVHQGDNLPSYIMKAITKPESNDGDNYMFKHEGNLITGAEAAIEIAKMMWNDDDHQPVWKGYTGGTGLGVIDGETHNRIMGYPSFNDSRQPPRFKFNDHDPRNFGYPVVDTPFCNSTEKRNCRSLVYDQNGNFVGREEDLKLDYGGMRLWQNRDHNNTRVTTFFFCKYPEEWYLVNPEFDMQQKIQSWGYPQRVFHRSGTRYFHTVTPWELHFEKRIYYPRANLFKIRIYPSEGFVSITAEPVSPSAPKQEEVKTENKTEEKEAMDADDDEELESGEIRESDAKAPSTVGMNVDSSAEPANMVRTQSGKSNKSVKSNRSIKVKIKPKPKITLGNITPMTTTSEDSSSTTGKTRAQKRKERKRKLNEKRKAQLLQNQKPADMVAPYSEQNISMRRQKMRKTNIKQSDKMELDEEKETEETNTNELPAGITEPETPIGSSIGDAGDSSYAAVVTSGYQGIPSGTQNRIIINELMAQNPNTSEAATENEQT